MSTPQTSTPAIPKEVVVWKIAGKSDGVLVAQNTYSNNRGYFMYCRTNGKYLIWDKQPLGINLDWTRDATVTKTHFRLPDGKERAILTGEKFALGIGGGEAFLGYAHRASGINLNWFKDPVYEWSMFDSSGEVGREIRQVKRAGDVAIFNLKAEPPDFLVYFDRLPGQADVGWTTSPEFWDKVLDTVKQKALKNWKKIAWTLVTKLPPPPGL